MVYIQYPPRTFYMSLKRIFLSRIPSVFFFALLLETRTHTQNTPTHTRRHKTKWRQATGGENRLKCNHGFELLLGHTFNLSQRSRHKMAKNGQRNGRESERLDCFSCFLGTLETKNLSRYINLYVLLKVCCERLPSNP